MKTLKVPTQTLATAGSDTITIVPVQVLHDIEFTAPDGRTFPVAVTVSPGYGGSGFATLTEPRTGRCLLACFDLAKDVTRERAIHALACFLHAHDPAKVADKIERNWRELPWLNPPRDDHA